MYGRKDIHVVLDNEDKHDNDYDDERHLFILMLSFGNLTERKEKKKKTKKKKSEDDCVLYIYYIHLELGVIRFRFRP